ncbi:MAG: hypothetical protein ACYTAO_16440 [Planctomycetota bacterium]|jgi:hypothetical protein
MKWIKNVLRLVFVPLSIPLIKVEINKLQRDIWRIDQKLNRHLRPDSETTDSPSKPDPALIQAFPYLREFPNPWVGENEPANGARKREPVG